MVNVIIPVYHSRETLPNTLLSLLNQTTKNFFITIVNDCDGENYTDIINKFTNEGLRIVYLPLAENVGPGLARQAAMDADNTSEFFMLCDSDDLLMPQAVESLLRSITLKELNIVASSFLRHEKDHNLLQDVTETAITWCAGKIYRAEYLKKNNIRFHPYLRLNEDSYFNVVAWNSTQKRGQLNEVTVLVMDNTNSLTRKEGREKFFIKGWEQYILSQVDGLQEIYKQTLTMNPQIAARTLVYLYHETMIAMSLNLPLNQSKIYLKKLNKHWMNECMNKAEFWREVAASCQGAITFNNTIIFPKISFDEWLKWGKEE